MIGCFPTQALAFSPVSLNATHATQAIAFGWKPGLSGDDRTGWSPPLSRGVTKTQKEQSPEFELKVTGKYSLIFRVNRTLI